MAGSYKHMTHKDGKPYKNLGAGSMLENDGDYAEALQQCYGMIWQMAHWLCAYDATREDLLTTIERAKDTWQAGYERGAGESPPWVHYYKDR